MTERDEKLDREPSTAAEWFVAIDERPPDDVAAARFSAWLDGSADHEIELERCSAAAELARRLSDDSDLRWAYAEAAAIAAGKLSLRGANRAARRVWRFGWGAAALVAIAGGTLLWIRQHAEGPAAARTLPDSSAAAIVASAPPTDSAVLLAGNVVVDVSSVAIVPFAATPGGERDDLAAGLSREIVAALAAVPGLYVVAAPSVYASADLPASEVGVQLGTRAIVRGSAALEAGRLRVSVVVLDAATDDVLWQTDYDRPVDELRAIQVDLVDNIAASLVDPSHRTRALSARVDRGVTSVRGDPASLD